MEEWLVEQTKEEASNLVTYNSLKRSEVTFNCMLHVSCGFAERFHPVTYISCAISLNNIICMLHIRLFFTLILFSVWCTLSIYRFILFQCCHESTKMTIDNVLKTFCKVFHLDYRSNTLIVWYQIQSWLCRLGNIQSKSKLWRKIAYFTKTADDTDPARDLTSFTSRTTYRSIQSLIFVSCCRECRHASPRLNEIQ